ncbi:MAG: hypothetical protein V3V90_00760, partial [Thermodesulfobacteriota bacterium]
SKAVKQGRHQSDYRFLLYSLAKHGVFKQTIVNPVKFLTALSTLFTLRDFLRFTINDWGGFLTG